MGGSLEESCGGEAGGGESLRKIRGSDEGPLEESEDLMRVPGKNQRIW